MKDPKEYTIHMVGHGHIDPTWLWRWTEGFSEVRATFRSALERMGETPAFKFSATSACFYEWVRDTEPELFEAIKEKVREGRWELAGGFWVETDCNVPCGESFVRQGLYSQNFFEEHFGQRVKVGFNPDSFGHAGTLPQILKKLGIDYYAYMRPSPPEERAYPGGTTFWWESPDGSRVLACNLLIDYTGNDTDYPERLMRYVESGFLNEGQRTILGFYGVGDHGGGPTKRAIATLQAAQEDPRYPEVLFSTLQGYFEAFAEQMAPENIPVVSEELQYHARGCFSVHAGIKRMNRRAEHALMTAERCATAAWLLHAHAYPQRRLHRAWTDLLYNQFHDILAGTSIASSYEDSRDQLGAARHRADVIANQALQAVARDIDTTAEGNTVVVFNPLTWPVAEAITAMPIVARELEKPFHVVDDAGLPVASQTIRHERPGDRRHTFVAEVPAMGFRCYHARSGPAPEAAAGPRAASKTLEATKNRLENTWWRLEFDPCDGGLTRLYDKENKAEVLERGMVLACIADTSDTWSHGVRDYTCGAGRFANASLDVVESGDVLATLRATSHFRDSLAYVETTLYRDIPYIDCRIRLNWQEAYHVLKLAFHTRLEEVRVTAEAPYGDRECAAGGGEEPCQQWVDLWGTLDGEPYGLGLLNDGCYAFDASKDGRLRMTLLRSPAYAHHEPASYCPEEGMPIIDQGWHDLRFRLLPHGGRWQDTRIVKAAWELNVPLISQVESAHPGRHESRATLMGTESENVLLSVVKQSEDGSALLIRGYETKGRREKTVLHLPYTEKSFQLEFAPHEIKTLRIDLETWTMDETNLLEESG